MGFSGKRVVVTGGTGALGSAVAEQLLAKGAACTVPYREEAEARRFTHRGHGRVTLVAAGRIADTSKAALLAQIDGNLISCFLCCRAAVRAMRSNAGGRIVNVASRQALEHRSGAGMSAYTIAKSGVATLTVALAEEVAKDGILVNAVAPSIMDTPANRKAMPKANFDA